MEINVMIIIIFTQCFKYSKKDTGLKCYSLIVCSYALHLCELSKLELVCNCLAKVGKKLLVVSPYKAPFINRKMGWNLLYENVEQRVRVRLYESIWFEGQMAMGKKRSKIGMDNKKYKIDAIDPFTDAA